MASMTTQAVTVDQLNRQVQKMNQRISAQDQRFRLNGFASFGITSSDEELAYNGVNDQTNFSRSSKMGVQMTFNLDSDNSVVMQLVSRGENNWETNAEWAYFKHEFGDGLSAKLGRIRLPAYTLSEFLDVGYAVPWAQMPNETYDALKQFSNMEGIDLTYNMDISDYTATFQLAYGRSLGTQFDLTDLISVNGVLQADTWSARAGYSAASVEVIDEAGIAALGLYGSATKGVDGSFVSVGFTYDPGDIYFTAEATSLKTDKSVIYDTDSMYASIGYRFGQFMPTLTFATTESTDDEMRSLESLLAANPVIDTYDHDQDLYDNGYAATPEIPLNLITALAGAGATTTPAQITALEAAALDKTNPLHPVGFGAKSLQAESNRDTQRIGLGLRYDMSAGTALKLQYDIITVEDEAGMFENEGWATSGANAPDGTNILTITIDTVF